MGSATIFVYRWFDDDNATVGDGAPPSVQLEIGFADTDGGIDSGAVVNNGNANFQDAAGTDLSSRSQCFLGYARRIAQFYNAQHRNGNLYDCPVKRIRRMYPEGYFAMEVRIYAREARYESSSDGKLLQAEPSLEQLNDEEPLFTYNTAIVR